MPKFKAWGIRRLDGDWFSGVADSQTVWGERPAPFQTEAEANTRAEKLKGGADAEGLMVVRLYAAQVR